MTTRTVALGTAFVLALGTAPVLAEHEELAGHAKHPVHDVILDGGDVRPSTTTMDHGDVLAFTNYSSHPVKVTFTEPKDLRDKIRCGLVNEQEAPGGPEWALFTWSDGTLAATIPPGRFASVCSLASGAYSITAVRQGPGGTAAVGTGILPGKAQIVVR